LLLLLSRRLLFLLRLLAGGLEGNCCGALQP
jgi:hypothetical protein